MSSSKMSLIGMQVLYANAGGDLFELLTLPEGVSKQTLVDTILMNGGEYEVLFADPEFVHDSMAIWSSKWEHTIERWVNALGKDYEPLWNYDRTEQEVRTPDLTNKRTPNLTHTDENKVSAYDSSTYEPSQHSTINSTGDETYTESGREVWDRRMFGNIGVTTSQDMLKQEIEVSAWSLYDSIARLFLAEYVIPVMI